MYRFFFVQYSIVGLHNCVENAVVSTSPMGFSRMGQLDLVVTGTILKPNNHPWLSIYIQGLLRNEKESLIPNDWRNKLYWLRSKHICFDPKILCY